jgi:hypothetical protein
MRALSFLGSILLMTACGSSRRSEPRDAGTVRDGALVRDASTGNDASVDGGTAIDAGVADAGGVLQDWAMRGSWTVNGRTPTSAADCEPIASVRVVLWDTGTTSVAGEVTSPCASGEFETDRLFRYGSYETQWRGLDAAGGIVGESAREPLAVSSPSSLVEVPAIDFLLASP